MGSEKATKFPIRVIFAFIAGFSSVLIFHQGTLSILHAVGFTAVAPFPYTPTKPFGLPQIWSLASWGGIWGIVFALVDRSFQGGVRYWLLTLAFGAIGPTLVAWFIVFPLKGIPAGGGWKLSGIVTGLMVNAAWGIGTALMLRGLGGSWTPRGHETPSRR